MEQKIAVIAAQKSPRLKKRGKDFGCISCIYRGAASLRSKNFDLSPMLDLIGLKLMLSLND
jgi:3-deoxy-D-manno-octulosonate 8-phosphate phosphatase KdsC-like HAD superfamily phosphatase